MSNAQSFDIKLFFKGKSSVMKNVTVDITIDDILRQVRNAFSDLKDHDGRDDNLNLKLLHKGKDLMKSNNTHIFGIMKNKKKINTQKIIIMSTHTHEITKLNDQTSDPTIRGFDNEPLSSSSQTQNKQSHWGPSFSDQNPQYKFCRFQSCTRQSFGHRPLDTTPHPFRALSLLHKLSTDPGIQTIMIERQLVVGTLGEMDPIDDRFMLKKERESAGASCLLGYNTNAGARIDVKLRTDDLTGFRPYDELVGTLLHELCHNWVGEHDVIFWRNYGMMRVEYFWRHWLLSSRTGYVVDGRSTFDVAGIARFFRGQRHKIDHVICGIVEDELRTECAGHGVPLGMVMPEVLERCHQLVHQEKGGSHGGRLLGSNSRMDQNQQHVRSARELALAAVERRLQGAQEKEDNQNNDENNNNNNNNNKPNGQ